MNDSIDDLDSAFGVELGRELPDTVDRNALKRMQFVSRVLDDLVKVPGTNFRFGLDPVMSLLPVSGDLISAGISLYIVVESANLGVSYKTLLRMLFNIGLDAAVGSVPVLGTLFDLVWKANNRNVELALADLADAADADIERDEEGTTIEVV